VTPSRLSNGLVLANGDLRSGLGSGSPRGAGDAEVAATGTDQLPGSHTGNHRRISSPSDGFEWWYLQIGTSRFSVALALHTTALLGGAVDCPYVSVTITWPRKRVIHDRIPLDQRELSWTSEGHLALRHEIVESSAGWKLALRGDGWAISGKIRRISPPWRICDSLLVTDDAGHEMHWSVPMPRGRWDGKLTIPDGSTFDAQGYAYQDHNWADSRLTRFVKGWSWHALADAESTSIWVNVDTCRGKPRLVGARTTSNDQMIHISQPQYVFFWPRELVKRSEYMSDSGRAVYKRHLVRRDLAIKNVWGFSDSLTVDSAGWRPRLFRWAHQTWNIIQNSRKM